MYRRYSIFELLRKYFQICLYIVIVSLPDMSYAQNSTENLVTWLSEAWQKSTESQVRYQTELGSSKYWDISPVNEK